MADSPTITVPNLADLGLSRERPLVLIDVDEVLGLFMQGFGDFLAAAYPKIISSVKTRTGEVTAGSDPPVLSRATTRLVEGEIPAAQVHELRRQLPGLTRGEGVLESEFSRYRAS